MIEIVNSECQGRTQSSFLITPIPLHLSNKPKCFQPGVRATGKLLKVNVGCFLGKYYFVSFFKNIRIKIHFPLIGPMLDFFPSSLADLKISQFDEQNLCHQQIVFQLMRDCCQDLSILERTIILKKSPAVHELVTVKMLDQSKEHVVIYHLRTFNKLQKCT